MSDPRTPAAVIEVSDGAAIPGRRTRPLHGLADLLLRRHRLLALLVLFQPDPYLAILQFVPDGILVTFEVTLMSIALALVIGLFTGIGRISRNRIVNGSPRSTWRSSAASRCWSSSSTSTTRWAASSRCRLWPRGHRHVGLLRRVHGRDLPGRHPVHPQGTDEAALSLGLTRGQAMRHVILPQTIRIILPPLGNEFIALLKDSSLVSILAVSDLLRRGREYASETFNYFETYTVVALVYLMITLFFSKLVGIMEERLHAGR